MNKTNLFETIFKRKSIRKYDLTPLQDNILDRINLQINSLKAMNDEIKTDIKIVSQKDINNLLPIYAPHYIIASSEIKEDYLTNIGFILQQLDLYLSANGIGCCWVGMAKPTKKIKVSEHMVFVIALAFGMPAEPLYRENISDFKRKSILDISDQTESNQLLEAIRLAPSGTNSQPWYFKINPNIFHAFCIKSNFLKAIIYEKMNKVDMGISLCHLWLAIKHINKEAVFFKDINAYNNPPKNNYYITSIKVI